MGEDNLLRRIFLAANLAVLLVIVLMPFLKVHYVTATSRVWTVDDDGVADFSTIQGAINAAIDGDVVFVHNGTYSEDVVLNKSLSLIGENRDSAVVQSMGGLSNSVNVNASDVLLANLTIRDGFCGVAVQGEKVMITSCRFLYNSVGVYLAGYNCSVIDNEFVRNDVGIDVFSSDSNVILNNRIEQNNWIGISVEFQSKYNLIKFNNISENGFSPYFPEFTGGISLYDSWSNTFVGNNIMYNSVQVKDHGPGLSLNVWSEDFPSCGNYWSDYVEKFPNASEIQDSGVWTTPYSVNDANVDEYPLVAPIAAFNVNALDGKSSRIAISSNSTVSAFSFSFNDPFSVSFNVTGANGTTGFCRVTIPNELAGVGSGWNVLIDGEKTNCTTFPTQDSRYLYFAYNHSVRTVKIESSEPIPEFTGLIILSLLTVVALTAIVARKRKFN
jgi:parallel beta-helix repeat protein